MRILAILRLTAILSGIAVVLPVMTMANTTSNGCDSIATDLASAIQRDGAKTLMLLEDALVINETCAGDIIRAALAATEGNTDLHKQIVDTAINVAPKMAAEITAAAGISSPQPELVAASSNSGVIGGEGDIVSDSSSDDAEEDASEFAGPRTGGSSIRGIYLVQPPPSGVPPSSVLRKCSHVSTSPCFCAP